MWLCLTHCDRLPLNPSDFLEPLFTIHLNEFWQSLGFFILLSETTKIIDLTSEVLILFCHG